MRNLVLTVLTLVLAGMAASAQQASQASVDAYVDLLRKDVRSQKVALIGQNMEFTSEEAAAFWPVYQKYEAEHGKMGDEKLAIIKDYAAHYDKMTNEKARELANRTFALEEKITQLKRRYFGEFEKVLPAIKAARLFQLENQMQRLIDLQIASELPLIRK